jgi:Na+/H+-dicarboxylate symporter
MIIANKNKSMKLWQKVMLGLILGIIFGLICPEYVNYVKPIGDIFLRLIKMIIGPLIFFTIVSGITTITNPTTLTRIGVKSVFAFVITTFFAVLFGLTIGLFIKPGLYSHIDFGQNIHLNDVKQFDIFNFILNIVPDNIFMSFANGNFLQIVFFAMFTAITLNKMGPLANNIKNGCDHIAKLILKMIGIIIEFSPFGSFALTAWVVGTQGINILTGLSNLIFAVLIAMFLQYLIFGLLILLFARVSPIPFYKKSIEYQLIAFSTSSTKATLATTMDVCQNKLGISKTNVSFVLPLGASINMDGLAIYLALTTIFFAQSFGISLDFYQYLIIILTATIGSIGGAGVPGGAIMMLPIVLSSVGLPIEGVAIIVGIDRIIDMIRTVISITGDATITLIVDASENTLDKEKYYQ